MFFKLDEEAMNEGQRYSCSCILIQRSVYITRYICSVDKEKGSDGHYTSKRLLGSYKNALGVVSAPTDGAASSHWSN